jgi:hypothetical protein
MVGFAFSPPYLRGKLWEDEDVRIYFIVFS